MMSKTLRTPHTRYNIRYHLVWIVKYRKDLIHGQLQQYLGEVIRGIAARYGYEIDTLGTDGNHLHLFIGAPPRHSPASIVKTIKSVSAIKVFETFPDLRIKELWGGEFWGDGYYVRTVGDEVTETVVREYINHQGKKQHKPFTQLRLF